MRVALGVLCSVAHIARLCVEKNCLVWLVCCVDCVYTHESACTDEFKFQLVAFVGQQWCDHCYGQVGSIVNDAAVVQYSTCRAHGLCNCHSAPSHLLLVKPRNHSQPKTLTRGYHLVA